MITDNLDAIRDYYYRTVKMPFGFYQGIPISEIYEYDDKWLIDMLKYIKSTYPKVYNAYHHVLGYNFEELDMYKKPKEEIIILDISE